MLSILSNEDFTRFFDEYVQILVLVKANSIYFVWFRYDFLFDDDDDDGSHDSYFTDDDDDFFRFVGENDASDNDEDDDN